MKKLLMLLALINTSVCFASSLNVSVTQTPLVTEAEWDRICNFKEVIGTDMSVNDLPSRVEYLAITPTADHNACQVKCCSRDREEVNSIARYYDNSESSSDRLLKIFRVNYRSGDATYRLLLHKDADLTIDTLYIEPYYYEDLLLVGEPEFEVDFISTRMSQINVGKIILDAPRFRISLNCPGSGNVRVDSIVSNSSSGICLRSSLNYNGRNISSGEYSFDACGDLIVLSPDSERAPITGVSLTKAQVKGGTYLTCEVIEKPVSSIQPDAFAATDEADESITSPSDSCEVPGIDAMSEEPGLTLNDLYYFIMHNSDNPERNCDRFAAELGIIVQGNDGYRTVDGFDFVNRFSGWIENWLPEDCNSRHPFKLNLYLKTHSDFVNRFLTKGKCYLADIVFSPELFRMVKVLKGN